MSLYDELSMNSNKTLCVRDDDAENCSLSYDVNRVSVVISATPSNKELLIVENDSKDCNEEIVNEYNNNNSYYTEKDLSGLDCCLPEIEPVDFSVSQNRDVADHNDIIVTVENCDNSVLEINDKARPPSLASASSSSSSSCSSAARSPSTRLSSSTATPTGIMPSVIITSSDETVGDSMQTLSEASETSYRFRGHFLQAVDDCSVNYSGGTQHDEDPCYQRERFRSFSACTTQALPMGLSPLPYAKSDTNVMAQKTSDSRNVDGGRIHVSKDDEAAGYRFDSSYIDHVLMEILDTERTYVKDLKDIIEGYVNYLRTSSEFNQHSLDQEALFGNIEDLYVFNRNFLKLLEEFGHDVIGVAECFVNQTEGFAIYSDYCTNYPRSMEVLTLCMKDEVQSSILKRQQLSLQHALPLGSYLLKPVQRILKYHLLLLNILNHHDALSKGHKVVEKAVESMTAMARHINDMKQRHEHAVRTQEIQSMLYGWDGADLTTLGDLILEDKFRLCGAKVERSVFLFEKAVLIAKRKEEGDMIVKAFIMCCNLMLIESIPKEPLCFHMIPFDCPCVQYTIQTRSLEQKRLWCQHLKQLILDNYSAAIPQKAKEIVMMLGKSREEEMLGSPVENMDYVRKQHSAPQYLQKARCRRKSAGLIFDFKLKPRSGPRKSDPSTQTSPHASPKVRRNSDVADLLGDALKNKEKFGLSPKLGLAKKGFFWVKDGCENSYLGLDTSSDNINSSLAAHSSEAVCSYTTSNQNNECDNNVWIKESNAGHFATICIPRFKQGSAGHIRSSSIAHRDSIAISKAKHASSCSGNLNNRDLCRKQCIKIKSKSSFGLDCQRETQPSSSSDRQTVESHAHDHGVQTDDGRCTGKDGKSFCNDPQAISKSENNMRPDLLADQGKGDKSQCVDEKIEATADTCQSTCKTKSLNTLSEISKVTHAAVPLAIVTHCDPESRQSDDPSQEPSTSPNGPCGFLRCKCHGACLLPSTNRKLFSETSKVLNESKQYGTDTCLRCGSKYLEDNHSNHLGRNTDEGLYGNAKISSRSPIDGKQDTLESTDETVAKQQLVFLGEASESCRSNEDQITDIIEHTDTPQTVLFGKNFPHNHDITEGSLGNPALQLSSELSPAGSIDCELCSVEQRKTIFHGVNLSTTPERNDEASSVGDEDISNGVVESLRNTVVHFLSKLTSRNPGESLNTRFASGSPKQSPSTPCNAEDATDGMVHSKDVRYRFVYYLARAYSSRAKKPELKVDVKRSPVQPCKTKLFENKRQQLARFLRNNELGSETIGGRMAEAAPNTLDRTLSIVPHQRIKRRAHPGKSDSTSVVTVIQSDSSTLTGSCRDGAHQRCETVDHGDVMLRHERDHQFCPSSCEMAASGRAVHRSSNFKTEEQKDSFECYYENQFSFDLEHGPHLVASSLGKL